LLNKETFFSALQKLAKEKNIEEELLFDHLKEIIEDIYQFKFNFYGRLFFEIGNKNKDFNFYKILIVDNEVIDSDYQINEKDINDKEDLLIGNLYYKKLSFKDFSFSEINEISHSLNNFIKTKSKLKIYNKYHDEEGKIGFGRVEEENNYHYLIRLSDATAVLPKNLTIPIKNEFPFIHEKLEAGKVIKFLIKSVSKDKSFGQIICSRIDDLFLRGLLELEIPEIQQNIIIIKNLAWIPGKKAKIAVQSRDPIIDPVWECIGKNKNYLNYLNNELYPTQIDIVAWSDDNKKFLINAFAPIKLLSIDYDEEEEIIKIVVTDKDIKKAIGTKGINIFLVAKLIKLKDYKLKIFSFNNAKENKMEIKWNANISEKEFNNLKYK
jgi:transcription termination/antitermination protein NusA